MCTYARAMQEFPTRKYPYGHTSLARVVADEPGDVTLESGHTYRFIGGRDIKAAIISPVEGRQLLADPFAQLVLFSDSALPVTLRTLLSRLDGITQDNPTALPLQRSFVVADGGQIPWTQETDGLQRDFRFVVIRQRDTAALPDVLVSASTNLDADDAFLQVIGWDPKAGAFQFYDRRDGSWVWAGSSWEALAPDTRGRGPFDSHVNGALNMKELKLPWVNWHSQSAAILDSALAPADPLRNETLWKSRSPAQEFETDVARPGIKRWTNSRFDRSVKDGSITGLPEFMRQVLETTTVNLVSSPVANDALTATSSVRLPLTFFLAADALVDVLGLNPDITVPQVAGDTYQAMLTRYNVRTGDGAFVFPGDTHFVFAVPEPAFEDLVILDGLLSMGVLTRKLASALLMVDFSNPVFSVRRSALLRYVPATVRVQSSDFQDQFIAAIKGAAAPEAGTPEKEFLSNWSLSDQEWEHTFEQKIETYFAALQPRLQTQDGFAPIFELAESRRREFRKRPLAEFRLTTPITNIPETAPQLELTPDGVVQIKSH